MEKLSESTLVIIKPDAFKRRLVFLIKSEIESSGLKIIPIGFANFKLDLVEKFYQWESVECPETVESYLCNFSIPLWLVKGEDVIDRMMKIKWRIRHSLCSGNHENLLHCSSNKNKFEWEYAVLKKEKMIYRRMNDLN